MKLFFLCVCNTNETNSSLNGCWPVNLVFWVANVSGNRRIWGDFPEFAKIMLSVPHWSRHTTCSLTSRRVVRGKIRIPLLQSSAEPQFLVFPWLLSFPSWGFSHPRAQPSAEGSNHSLSRERHIPQAGLQILIPGFRLSLIKSTKTLLNCFPSD